MCTETVKNEPVFLMDSLVYDGEEYVGAVVSIVVRVLCIDDICST